MRISNLRQVRPVQSPLLRTPRQSFGVNALSSSAAFFCRIGTIICLGASTHVAAADTEATPQYPYGSTVTVVCGALPQGMTLKQPVLPNATYYTAITLNARGKTTDYDKILSIAYPEEQAGPIIKLKRRTIPEQGAVELDCPELMQEVLTLLRDQKDQVQRLSHGFKGILTIKPLGDTPLYISVLYAATGSKGDFAPSHLYTIVKP